ncbi:RNA polymerase sigma factor [Prevotella sp. 10(H)]|uniref:RNA polymerase sigma factor n=1 Tax=Prevotella sp. 10(H) TaxID=1158294 RepID=UPI0004A71F4B|nr:RNA polymerase sigma factor [Prevotella sp. 10(H)]
MAKDRNKEEFLDILENNIGIIIKISGAYAQIKQDREDLINDIIFELWKSYTSFQGNSKISTWIYRVTLNISMNYKRKNIKKPVFSSLNELKQNDISIWLQTGQYDFSELEILYNCIDKLNEMNKAIILLYLDGNSYDEISEITGITKTNVGTRINRIKEEIRNLATSKNK